MVLRSDEAANKQEYEAYNERKENIKGGVKKVIGAGISATSLGLGARILPFLNEYVPLDLAMKGINKVAPKIGQFLMKGQKNGLDLKQGLEFLKEKISTQEQETTKTKENRNIIEQYDPELHTYIDQNLKKGMSLLEAGNQALKHGRFKKAIEKMTKDHKAPWASILQTVFGQTGQPKQPQKNEQTQQPQSANWAAIVDSLKQVLGE